MRAHLQKLWDLLHGSLWFVPTLLALTATALALLMVQVDQVVPSDWVQGAHLSWFVYTGGAAGASLVLSTIAGSAVTIAGTVFSMTLVALSLASQQLGPRLLRNFMRDRVNQVVLGTFTSTFIYCLLVLRTVRREGDFVPHLAVTFGVLLALASLAVLIYFIYHVSVSIQADAVVQRVGAELLGQIKRLFPQDAGSQAHGLSQPTDWRLPKSDQRADIAVAVSDGYLQHVDIDALVELAERNNLQLQLERRPGDYLIAGQPLFKVWPAGSLDPTLTRQLQESCAAGDQRTAVQDLEFLALQLVEIAVRALSPAINDPFSAMACLDRLASALVRLARCDVQRPYRLDQTGALRLVLPTFTFAALAEIAFTQICQNARGSSAVHEHLLLTLNAVAAATQRPGDRAALLEQAGLMVRSARAAIAEPADRRVVEARYAAALALLAPDRAPS